MEPTTSSHVSENSNSGDSGLGDEGVEDIVTSAMIEEEERLARENEAAIAKEEARRLKEQKKLELERSDEAIREQNRKGLMSLLERSKFYSNFMRTRLEERERKAEKREKAREKREMNRSPKKATTDSRKRKATLDYSNILSESVAKVSKLDPSKAGITNLPSHASPSSEKTAVESSRTKITPMGIEVSELQPDLLEGVALRDYQLEGFKWLKRLFGEGMNGILADEMGLGKTVQTISLICYLYSVGISGPFLIVAPLSTLPNWIHEFETFAPKVPVILYHGSSKERERMGRTLLKDSQLMGRSVLPVIVTSFEVPLMDQRILGPITWKYIVVDEGHRIKNYKSSLSVCLTGMRSINRLLLTGTPLQNDLVELWSLLHFLLPEIFDSLNVFERLFTADELSKEQDGASCLMKEEKSNILTLLQEVLEPFLLRRLKADVNVNLPRKKEILVRCPMTKIQLDLYKAVLDGSIVLNKETETWGIIPDDPEGRNKRYSKSRDPSMCRAQLCDEDINAKWHIVTFGKDGFQYKLNIKMTLPHIALIKILNHPYLVYPKVLPGSNTLDVDEELIEASGKMTILDGLLKRLKERGHKVLIFSTYTTLLDLIQEYAEMVGYTFRRLDGRTKIDDRRLYMREFNTDPEVFLFLLSTRAGGLGINLTGADTVIIFNSDWNPQADLQAQDRCHRIGQKNAVIVYRFMVPGTFDERVVDRASSKRKLEKMVLQSGKFKHGSTGKGDIALTLQELKELLNEKQHNLEIQPNGTTLTDEQWETLLDRSDLILNENDEGNPSGSARTNV